MKYICPLIVVKDISISRRFYEDVLEQEVAIDHGENVTFKGDFAIHLESHYQKLIHQKPIKRGGNQFELYFEHDDLKSLAKKLKEENVEWVHEIMEQPWRQKVMRFYDPDKHIIEVGESIEHLCRRLNKQGMGLRQVVQTTGLPEAYVKELLSES